MIIATTFGIGFIVLSAYVYHVLGIHNARHSCSSMKASRSDGIGGVGITLVPNTGEYENVVIWMHGLGDTADGWAQSSKSMQSKSFDIISVLYCGCR